VSMVASTAAPSVTISWTPPTAVPETPWAGLVPVVAAAVIGAAAVAGRRKRNPPAQEYRRSSFT